MCFLDKLYGNQAQTSPDYALATRVYFRPLSTQHTHSAPYSNTGSHFYRVHCSVPPMAEHAGLAEGKLLTLCWLSISSCFCCRAWDALMESPMPHCALSCSDPGPSSQFTTYKGKDKIKITKSFPSFHSHQVLVPKSLNSSNVSNLSYFNAI